MTCSNFAQIWWSSTYMCKWLKILGGCSDIFDKITRVSMFFYKYHWEVHCFVFYFILINRFLILLGGGGLGGLCHTPTLPPPVCIYEAGQNVQALVSIHKVMVHNKILFSVSCWLWSLITNLTKNTLDIQTLVETKYYGLKILFNNY